jgi:single-stranded-DNA-specific exonuclease
MISISGKKWKEIKTNKNLVEKIKQDYSFSEIVSKLILTRNFDKEEIFSLLDELNLKNVFSNNNDFKVSANILLETIKNKDNICILGDYDVDGSVATSLFVRFFENINHSFFYYIPDREKDGYGASTKLFKKLILKKPKLIIMVDCGSTSNDAIDFLNRNKVKSIIIDHHEISKPYPKANSIINPKKNNGYIEYEYMCATTLVYFFLELFIKQIDNKIILKDYLILVLLAIVCDVMPIRKINRVIALNALKEFKIEKSYMISEIFNLIEKKSKLNINDLGFLIGPILNAGGRLGKSSYATELLSTNDKEIINQKSIKLINLNNKRKEIERLTLKEIDFDNIDKENNNIIIYYNANINEGLIGIIAARLKDHFNKPSIVITRSGDLLKGSARSTYNYDIGLAIRKAKDCNIIHIGGGHKMAAGFSLKNNNLKDFKTFIFRDFINKCAKINQLFHYDSELSSSAFNKEFFTDIKKIGPFGTGNPVPTFLFKDLKVIKNTILKDKHISSILKSKSNISINAISFDSMHNKIGEYLLNYKKNFNVIGHINENFWNNKNTLQLTITDIIL